ncbi:hypothetical protein FPV67DRAFT_1457044 [Lyophyllum atratum]|nr:hypothetical protein FPV67DRAFT_1457044 [Lyophyllum atratum]
MQAPIFSFNLLMLEVAEEPTMQVRDPGPGMRFEPFVSIAQTDVRLRSLDFRFHLISLRLKCATRDPVSFDLLTLEVRDPVSFDLLTLEVRDPTVQMPEDPTMQGLLTSHTVVQSKYASAKQYAQIRQRQPLKSLHVVKKRSGSSARVMSRYGRLSRVRNAAAIRVRVVRDTLPPGARVQIVFLQKVQHVGMGKPLMTGKYFLGGALSVILATDLKGASRNLRDLQFHLHSLSDASS